MTRKDILRVFVIYGIVLAIWTVYRAFFQVTEWMDVFVIKPVVWLLPLFLFKQTSWIRFLKNDNKRLMITYVTVFVAAAILVKFLWHSVGVEKIDSISALLWVGVTALGTAVVEEIFFRGYLQSKLATWVSDPLNAVFVTAAMFSAIHAPGYMFLHHYDILQIASLLLFQFCIGLAFGILFQNTRTLQTSIIAHATWNTLVVI